MPKLGVMEHWFDGEEVVPGATLEERLANLEAWGYQGMQYGARTLRNYSLSDLKRIFAQSSIRLLIHGRRGRILAADRETRQAAVEEIKTGLYEAAELDVVGSILVPIRVEPEIPPPAPPRTIFEVEREILLEELAKLAPVAEEVGKPILLEPLNRYESHFLRSLGQAAEICRAVGSPGIKMMADTFHMNIEDADLGKAIEEVADCLAYVHLADSNRYQPGVGHFDFYSVFAALKHMGYDGYLTLECKVLGADRGAALAESARYIQEVWEEADADRR